MAGGPQPETGANWSRDPDAARRWFDQQSSGRLRDMKANGPLDSSACGVAGLAVAAPGSATPATRFLRPPAGPVLRVWRPNICVVLAATTLLVGIIPLRGADNTDAEIQALREQIRLLDQRLNQLQQQQ